VAVVEVVAGDVAGALSDEALYQRHAAHLLTDTLCVYIGHDIAIQFLVSTYVFLLTTRNAVHLSVLSATEARIIDGRK
jgi:hypothetical protein